MSNHLSRYRRTLLSYCNGKVLEMGIGTGINFQFYGSDVDEIVGVDWS